MLRFQINPMHSVDLNQIFSKRLFIFLLLVLSCITPIFSSSVANNTIDSMLLKLETDISEIEKAELMMGIAREYYYRYTRSHSICQPWVARSCSCTSAWCIEASNEALVRAAAMISSLTIGLLFCGMVLEPPRAKSADSRTSPTSVWAIKMML